MPYVYLAGPITGKTYEESIRWRSECLKRFTAGILGVNPMRTEAYLSSVKDTLKNTYTPNTFDNDFFKVFGTDKAITQRDKLDMHRSDIVLMNLLNTNIVSVGTMIEVGWADAMGKPIVLVIEDEGNIHDHCMLRDLCAFRVNNLDLAIESINGMLTIG